MMIQKWLPLHITHPPRF